nr:hypothetical protein [uncultured Rhodopila sp.]
MTAVEQIEDHIAADAVHRNPGRNKRAVPLVVVVQPNRFGSSSRRLIVPILLAEEFGLTDSDVGLHPSERLLDDTRIIKALDAVLSGARR